MNKAVSNLDHLVIAAHTLEQGVEFVRETFDVTVPFGGEHPKMGTHNHLAQIGHNIFIEIIAINPDLAPPSCPRWFNLDDPALQNKLKTRPRLISWVINTNDIYECVKGAACSFGKPEPISRGNLSWYFGLPADGRLLAGGMLPYLIQWKTTAHPASQMADIGLELMSLKIYHPKDLWLQNILQSVGAQDLVEVIPSSSSNEACLEATFNTPAGIRTLRSD